MPLDDASSAPPPHASRAGVVVVRRDGTVEAVQGAAPLSSQADRPTGLPAGLALLTVRDVVVAHRGTVEVESVLGHRATFRMRLPAGRAEPDLDRLHRDADATTPVAKNGAALFHP